jgi:hypothetical protein
MSFADLKRKSQSNFDFLQKELTKSSNEGGADERIWKAKLDPSGNGYAVLRFLPAPDGESLPWAKVWSHAFQGPGGWLIDNCPTTKGEQCPVCAANNKLWNSGVESDKEIARNRKRKLSYYSNVYVVTDKANPDNEGKVFLYKYGKKIHDKILAAMQPEFQDETPVNVFDLWEGANFKLKIKTVAGYWNYDSSEFASPAALSADEDEMESIWKQAYSLESYTTDDQFKSYEALDNRMGMVLGQISSRPVIEEEEYTPAPVMDAFTESTPAVDFNAPDITATSNVTSSSPFLAKSDSSDDDDALSYFAKLASED